MTREEDERLLREANPTGRFTDRASDYVRYRPTYPAAAFEAMLSGLGDPAALVAADVGAGTGISARQLAERGPRVTAIEPNAAMRAAAAAHPRVEWRDGTAEATGLPEASVDLVLSAQAFHWFRQRQALAEFRRMLRPGGRMALMWNGRDSNDPLTRGYIEAIHAVGGEHAAERLGIDPEVERGEWGFTPLRLQTFEHAQEMDGPGLLGRATSASYVPRDGPALEELARRLRELFERHRDARGLVRMKYRTRLHLAERV